MAKLPTEERVGATILGRYHVVRLIEKGGMGAVYEVTHKNLARRFAAKMLSSELSRNEEALARFRREADAIARLRHPNIVDIVDWDLMEDGSPVLVMEYLRGQTLADQIARHGPLPWPLYADIADRALSAIQVAHAAGIVHRDLKPSNIFLAVDDAGQIHPKVLDFGVSKVADTHTMVGTNPTILGTPSYMSPEQAEGRSREVGPATDVWAMGSVLYEMATGRMAYWGDSVPSILYMVCHGSPEPILRYRPDAPLRLVNVIERTLTRDQELRVRDASRLRRELRAALAPVLGDVHFDQVTPYPRPSTPPPVLPAETPVPVAIARMASAPVQEPVDADEPTRIESAPPDMPEHTTPGRRRPARGRRILLLTAAGLAAIAIGILLAVAIFGGGDEEEQGNPVAPPPVATTIEIPPQEVELTLRSEPAGALVMDAKGARVGTTPFTARAVKGSGARFYVLRMKRFHDRRVDWSVEGSQSLDVRMRRADRPVVGRPGSDVDPNATDNPFRSSP